MDFVEIGLKFTYLLLAVGIIAAIVMPLFLSVTQDPKGMVKSAIGVGLILVVYLLGYALASSEVTPIYAEFGVDSVLSKRVGGLLVAMYILMVIALVGILFTEVSRIVK